MDGLNILVAGGTGSFGHAFVSHVLNNYRPNKLIIYSRDEFKQDRMAKTFAEHKNSDVLSFFIGDVRDAARLSFVMKGIDIVFHGAAMKQVVASEYNPMECIKTNILGAENLIDAAIRNDVPKVVAVSTDKAVKPINLYGSTKACMEKLFIAANLLAGEGGTRFCNCRYGNVIGSRGSIIPIFRRLAEEGKPMPITDERMTRYWLRIEDGVKFVDHCGQIFRGGETFVKKVPSMKITDLARAIQPDCELKIIGIRPGEKLHEAMVSEEESLFTYEYEDKFVIMPQIKMGASTDNTTYEGETGKAVPVGFSYTSENNTLWLTPQEILDLIRETGVISE